jgi:signal transduction histidine kinase/CheY-like chemotaxis protein
MARDQVMTPAEPKMPRFTGWLRPVVDAVARVKAGVHRKLLFGFLIGALLLVAMGLLSLLVIRQMNDRMIELDDAQVKAGRAQEMLYAVTAQSHYRAMALLLPDDAAKYNGQVEEAKATFARLLDELHGAEPANAAFYKDVRAVNDDYRESGQKVLALIDQGRTTEAGRVHLEEEHPTSHLLENSMRTLIETANEDMAGAQTDFRSARDLFTGMVIAFSVVSVIVALLLGFVLSWAFILPVRKMERALADITAGNFDQRVDVPNRDEFGGLARDLNSTSERLATLFDDQQRLTTRLSETNASLERTSEAKSRFLANVSHELRTPMTAILGFTDALLAGVDGPLNPDQETSLRWVQRGGQDLLGLINEILDLSKIEAGKLTLDVEPFDPRELVDTVVAQHRSLAAQKGIRFGWHDAGMPSEVALDRQRVRQILVNLVGNALKFTEAGEVEVTSAQMDDARFHVAVRDTGPGISPELQEVIFEEFHHAEGAAPGTGLGLPISRRLARAMGGDVTFESEPSRGSVFHLILPLDCRPTPAGSDDLPPVAATDGQRLLLCVDDDPSVVHVLQKMVSGHGYRVAGSQTARTAIGDARNAKPVAILIDVRLQGSGALDLLRELKSDPETSAIRVIVLSGADPGDLPEGVDGWLSKPVQQVRLLRMLDDGADARKAPL